MILRRLRYHLLYSCTRTMQSQHHELVQPRRRVRLALERAKVASAVFRGPTVEVIGPELLHYELIVGWTWVQSASVVEFARYQRRP